MPRRAAKSLIQASLEAPQLARIAELIKTSNSQLASIQELLPAGLRKGIRAGPLEGGTWCLFAKNNSVAAKLRQLQPTLEAHLRSKGWDANSIRIKVLQKENS
jgi:hypothetical protein